jgi:hypothetical protein
MSLIKDLLERPIRRSHQNTLETLFGEIRALLFGGESEVNCLHKSNYLAQN